MNRSRPIPFCTLPTTYLPYTGGFGTVLSITEQDGIPVVGLPRRFDADTTQAAESELRPVLERHPKRLLFDFEKTEYISSAGVRVILATSKTLKETDGVIALCTLGRETRYVLEITGFTKFLTIFPDREKALKHWRKEKE
ncbi:MAG: STAS domain-containing protein [Methanomicrobiales archaeon]|nr:STAS domain-containing protein [Methanomicrobiales archaeon]